MACKYHQTTAAINTCKKCGQEICDSCSIPFKGVFLCKDCLAEELKTHPAPHMAPPPRPVPPPPPRPYEHREMYPGYAGFDPRRKRVNGFLLLCCSMLPGANYMYMGLIKRGLFVMSSFFMTIFLMTVFHNAGALVALLAFACAITAITSFFDGFALRRRINAGEHVEDSVSEITGFVKRHKTKFIIGGVALTVYGALAYVMNIMNYYGLRSLSKLARIPEVSSWAMRNGYHGYTYVGFNPFSLIPCALIFLFIFFIVKHMISRGRERSRYDSARYTESRHTYESAPRDDSENKM